MPKPQGTLLLSRQDVASLLDFGDYLGIVEHAFRLHAQGKTLPLSMVNIPAPGGEFHIRAGGLHLPNTYVGVKVNAGFFQNRLRFGLPNIQGTIVLCDGENGYPVSVMDSVEITINRTGATTALAAKYLARPDSRVVTLCGCGTQGRVQLRALCKVLPVKQAYAFDAQQAVAERFAVETSADLDIAVSVATDPGRAVRRSDVCVTCTPARKHFLKADDVPSGMFLAAVGADSPEKQEIDPRLLRGNTVVVDLLEQCAEVGELHHALQEGIITRHDVYAELGQIVAGEKPGRRADDEIIIFDATGTALQDTASAAAVYENAVSAGRGACFDFFA